MPTAGHANACTINESCYPYSSPDNLNAAFGLSTHDEFLNDLPSGAEVPEAARYLILIRSLITPLGEKRRRAWFFPSARYSLVDAFKLVVFGGGTIIPSDVEREQTLSYSSSSWMVPTRGHLPVRGVSSMGR